LEEDLKGKSNGNGAVSALAIKRGVIGNGGSDFLHYARVYRDDQSEREKYWEAKKVGVLISKVESFAQSKSLAFTDPDAPFIRGFERFMRRKLDNSTNTVGKNLQILNRIIKSAVPDGLLPAGANPFLNHRIKSERTTRQKLSFIEIQSLERLDLSDRPTLELARNLFLFSFYCAGVRFGDMCRLTWSNVDGTHLKYRMAKTSMPKSVPLVPQALEILSLYQSIKGRSDEFVFPLLSRYPKSVDPMETQKRISSLNANVNRSLRQIGTLIDLSFMLSFHISRHSFADFARRKGMDLYSISKALGHSDLKTTQTYLAGFDQEAVDGALSALFAEG